MSDDGRRLQSYYAARATEYDDVYRKPERQSDLRAIEGWLPSVFRDATVLEVACGTGYWTQFIAPAAAQVLALDASEETLAIARSRMTAGQVRFLVGDAYNLSPQLGQFDAAFAGFWLSHVPKARRQAFLRGLQARLVPGAKVVLLDNLYVEGSSSKVAETDEDGNTYQLRRLKDGSSHRVLKNFPGEAELLSLLDGLAASSRFTTWPHYWALEYVTAKA